MELCNLTIYEIKEQLEQKQVKAVEVLDSIFKRIDKVEHEVNSYLTLTKEIAIKKAEDIDNKIENAKALGSLAGIPMGIKDNICTKGILTTCGSNMLKDFIPPYSATVYEKLLMEDGIMLGKTNMDEFAMGSSTESSFFKKTKNPWDINKVPGGSSGGSAAAVAAGEAYFAIGSDTGGSIRQPAAFCGVVGLKPTYGLISRYGLVSMANSLDSIGIITKSIRDCALILNTIAGPDSKDGTSIKKSKIDYIKNLGESIKDIKVAIPKEYFDENLSDYVKKALFDSIKVLEDLGIVCEEVSLPYTKYAMPVYYIISQSEISTNLARFDGIRFGHRTVKFNNMDQMYVGSRVEGFGDEVKRRIMLGTYWLSGDNFENFYKKANTIRELIKEDFNNIFSKYNIILTPTTATTAFELGLNHNTPLKKGSLDGYTVAANLAGIPAISIPCGFHNNLPIGMQLMGRAFDEETILKVARAFEESTDYNKRPSL